MSSRAAIRSPERRVDLLQVESLPDRSAMARAAGRAIGDELRRRLAGQARVRMILAAAPSQADTLDELVGQDGIDWGRVTAFHMDEYIGLPTGSPQRFVSWLDRHVFSRLPFGAVHRIVPEPDAGPAASAYAGLLAAAPIDIVCLGIGVNGHLAFNDPPVADFRDPADVKIVTLDPECRQQQVDDDCFANLDAVPLQAITLTIPRLMRGDRLFCVVPGKAKRDAVRRALSGPISTTCPASILRTHAACTLYLDPQSDPDA
jgi:glucosamine-6-phosphate deaminase